MRRCRACREWSREDLCPSCQAMELSGCVVLAFVLAGMAIVCWQAWHL